jgi:hypothetical protein
MRIFLTVCFVLIAASAFLFWRDERTISIEALLALPLLFVAWRGSPAAQAPRNGRRLLVVSCLAVIVVANLALLALGSIPWYATLLAAPLLLLGWHELRRPTAPEASAATTASRST